MDANHSLEERSTANHQKIGSQNSEMATKVIAALRHAHEIWLRSCNSSNEAQQAAQAIKIVLAKMTPETDTPSTVGWDRTTLGGSSNTNENQTFDDMLMTVNPTLYAGLQSDASEFPDFSGLDFEMASLKMSPIRI